MATAFWRIWVDDDWEPNIDEGTYVTLHYTQTGAIQAVGRVISSQALARPDGQHMMSYELMINLPANPGWIHSLVFPQGTVYLFPNAVYLHGAGGHFAPAA
ncbi:MAG TPA: hypothetical protein PKO15_11900 [Fibrobacteria bacterium]|nr:hypothetical protein [Fibrobacteria bacterium]HOX53217.1 hypothetical protein [Fibrobacteria bacterium]